MSEILTLGIGNYGVLTAAHWANSTTKFDTEQRIIYTENRRSGAAVRLLLLDEAQPARVVKEIPLNNTNAEVMEKIPANVALPDEEDGEEGEEEENDELDFGWTWRTATRHPRDAADQSKQQHADPETDDADAAESDAADEQRVEVDDEDLLDELKGAPPQRLVPWWKYITAPTNRANLVTQVHFDDPIGGSLAHSFGYGLQQRWGGESSSVVGLETYADRIRRSIEDADSPQGLQLFVDADSSYGGLACGLLEFIGDEFDDIRATVAHSIFPSVEFPASGDFVKKRRQELLLNRALATAYLSQKSALYTPYEVNSWSMPHLNRAFTIDDDVATSAIIAAASDTALYGARQRATPQFQSLRETCALLRPGASMRIVGVAHALPFPIPAPERSSMRRSNSSAEAVPASLWSTFQGAPLLRKDPWRPLSFAFTDNVKECQATAGRVEAHAVTLRGVAGLRDVEYPREEAILRYGFPLRQSRFTCGLFDEGYPVSSSFPIDRLFGAPRLSRLGPRGPTTAPVAEGTKLESELTSFSAGTHLVNTNQAGAYLKEICAGFESTKYDWDKLHRGYGFERDEWLEVGETLNPLRDSYDRDADASDDGEDFE